MDGEERIIVPYPELPPLPPLRVDTHHSHPFNHHFTPSAAGGLFQARNELRSFNEAHSEELPPPYDEVAGSIPNDPPPEYSTLPPSPAGSELDEDETLAF